MGFVVAALGIGGPVGAEDGLSVQAAAWVRGIEATGPSSWRSGGFGRLTEGGNPAGDSAGALRSELDVGMDWRPSPVFLLHVHGLARQEPPRGGRDPVGLAEAFLQVQPELSGTTSLRLRLGMLFPGPSRENTGPLWSSPYTLSLSALNSWIGEEMRLTGAEAAVVVRASGGSEFQAGGTVYGVNDTLGALVAWRGWGPNDRLTVLGETVPLPPLASLRPGAGFAAQRADGTRPIDALDHRLGWQARVRWSSPDRAVLEGSYLDNRADRQLHDGQYAWHTRFARLGGEVHLGGALTLLAEAAEGDTGMGPMDILRPHVDVRFYVGYALLSWRLKAVRFSARYDRFRNIDRDGTEDPDGEEGSAWTVAALWMPVRHVRLGLELMQVRAQRPAAGYAGADPNTDARRLTAEVRFSR